MTDFTVPPRTDFTFPPRTTDPPRTVSPPRTDFTSTDRTTTTGSFFTQIFWGSTDSSCEDRCANCVRGYCLDSFSTRGSTSFQTSVLDYLSADCGACRTGEICSAGFCVVLRIRAEAPAAGMNSASLVSLRTFAMTPPVLSAIALLRTHFATMVLAWDGSPAWMPPGKPPLATPISILVGMKWFRSRVHQPSRPIDR